MADAIATIKAQFSQTPPASPTRVFTSATPLFTVVPVIEATPSQTPVTYADFQLIGVSYTNGQMMVSLSIPGISGEYRAILGEQEYTCFTLEDHSNILYCTGEILDAGEMVGMTIYLPGQNEPVLALDVAIPAVAAPAPTGTPEAPTTSGNDPAPGDDSCGWFACDRNVFSDEPPVPAGCMVCYKLNNGDDQERHCGFHSCKEMYTDLSSRCNIHIGQTCSISYFCVEE